MRLICSNIKCNYTQRVGVAIFWLCLLFIPICNLLAQDSMVVNKKAPFDYDQIFSTNYWNFFVRPSVTFATPVHFSHSPLQFETMPSPAVTFGWMYQINFKESWGKKSNELTIAEKQKTCTHLNRWGIQTGISISLYWNSFNYSLPASYSGVGMNFGAPQKLKDEQVLSIPVYAVYKLPLYDKCNSWLATFKLGIDINIEVGNSFQYSDIIGEPNGSNNKTVFEFYQQTTFRGYTAYPSLHASAGFNYIMPNKKMLNLQIVGSYAPSYSEQGTFTFMPGTPQEVGGTSIRRLNYIGFELDYIFTRVRHMKKAKPGYRIPPIKNL